MTLDPNDWEQFRALAHRMVDDSIDHLRTLRERPCWQPVPERTRAALAEPVPYEPQGDAATYAMFREHVLPYTNGNRHPMFFGWAQGNGTPLGMMADMLAASMNPHLAGFDQSPALVEDRVIRWFAELMGFPADAGGVLALGGTMANILGLAAARQRYAGFDVRDRGLFDAPRLLVYASAETHGWLYKSLELMGLGRASLATVATKVDGTIEVPALAARIREDRRRGLRPIAVVGNAGTVNTGAIDELDAIAGVCSEESVWFHVDGALGGLAMLSDRLRGRLRGLERADSVAFDLHKWMYQPFDVACVLVREPGALEDTFARGASYIAVLERGVIAGGLPFADRGVDLTRGFRALKLWMAMKAHGVRGIAREIENNVEQAELFAAKIEAEPALELLAPVTLNVVCFRHRGTHAMDAAELDAFNTELLLRIQESGRALPSSTTLHGKLALRCAFVNHRTEPADLDALLALVLELASGLR